MPEREPAGGTRSMRSQVLASIVGVAVLAVALFAVPLAWLVARTFRDQQLAALDQEATRVIALLPDRVVRPGADVPAPTDPAVSVGLYAPDGTLMAGSGPAADADARGAQDTGVTRSVDEGATLAVYVPFRSEGATPVTVRASASADGVQRRTLVAWALLAGLALLVLAVAALVARARARTLARPFEQLAASARDLGEGAFALSVPHTGVREAEDVARALESAAARIGERVHREQRFADDASHQLRTPVTAARLTLEGALSQPSGATDDDVRAALDQLDRLERTIDDLLVLARRPSGSGPGCEVGEQAVAAAGRWRPMLRAAGRDLVVAVEPGLPPVAAHEAAVRQVLDVLLDNALRHGSGPVRVRVRDLAGAVAVDVQDAGSALPVPAQPFDRGRSGAGGTGIGLALARDLTEAEGGRLLLADAGPPTVFTLVLPGEEG